MKYCVRFWVIASLTISCILIAALSLSGHVETIYGQLFYFPILYAAYFYPRKGIWFSGACAIVYEVLAYIYVFPDTGGLIVTTGQAILFVCIAGAVAYFTEKVNASEDRYRSIFESSLLGIVLFDQNSFSIRLANTQIERMLGYTADDLSRISFADLFFTKDAQRRFFENLGSSENIIDFETLFLTKSREPSWVNLSWSRIDNNLVSCTVIDINQRKRAERAAEENYLEYKQVTENSPTGIIIIRNNRIVYLNPAFTVFSGYETEELIDTGIRAILHPDDAGRFPDLSSTGTASAFPMASYRFRTKTGTIRNGALFFTPITQRGEPAVLINVLDVTERHPIADHANREKDMNPGIGTAGIPELCSPVYPTMGNLRIAFDDQKATSTGDDGRAQDDHSVRNVDREQRKNNQMRELSNLDSGLVNLDYSYFDLTSLIESVIDAGGYAARADLILDMPENLVIEADERRIAAVIDSLISNAVVSRIDFTHITISAHSSESSPGVDGTRMRYKAHRNRDSCEV